MQHGGLLQLAMQRPKGRALDLDLRPGFSNSDRMICAADTAQKH